MRRLGQIETDDVDFVNVAGLHWKGRDEVVREHASRWCTSTGARAAIWTSFAPSRIRTRAEHGDTVVTQVPTAPEVQMAGAVQAASRFLDAERNADMAHYVDGFVFPVPRHRLGAYQRVAEAAAAIWKEHGALDYREYVGDDLTREGTRSFIDLVAATADDAVVFGWVVFESREARDRANERVAADPRMADLIESSNSGFDATRMAYGGFRSLV